MNTEPIIMDGSESASWPVHRAPGWTVHGRRDGSGGYTMTTPEGEQVTDRFGNPWIFSGRLDAYLFACRAMDPDWA